MRRHARAGSTAAICAPDVRQSLFAAACLCALALVVLFGSGASSAAAAEGECPNEQLRIENNSTALPDCRAYELVSPTFKFGQPALSTNNLALSADGSRIAISSLGAFGEAGISQGTNGASYIAGRGPGGWLSTPLDPTAAEYKESVGAEGNAPLDVNQDMSEALFSTVPIARPRVDKRLFIRRADGSLEEVGPMVPSTAVSEWVQARLEHTPAPTASTLYAGASPDFSHTFFYLQGPLSWDWPGDTRSAGEESLYEYTGTSNQEPELVAVRNNGPLHGSPHLNEGAELIGKCGAAIGSGNSNDNYNAISPDGAIVFFSVNPCEEGGPSVREIYARIDRSQTVAISEPSAADCSACDTEAGVQREGIFQGASEDGSKVFFLSEQALLPGASETTLYEYDFDAPAGEKVSLVAPKMRGVVRVAEQGNRVYLVSEAALATNVDAKGEAAEAGNNNLYVFNTASRQFTFIAALSGGDSGDWSQSDGRSAQATPDGRFLLFMSTADPTPDASGTALQYYRYNAQAGEAGSPNSLLRVTIGQNGFNNNGNSAEFSFIATQGYGSSFLAGPRGTSISDDGSKVFFGSPTGLTPDALNEACAGAENECAGFAYNLYEWEQAGTGDCQQSQSTGCISLLSDGHDRHAVLGGSTVTILGANPSASSFFFSTADQLVPADTDGQDDVYVARTDGGFPAPAQPAACQGDTCQGQTAGPPAEPAAATSTFSGPSNQKQKPKKRHKRRKSHKRHGRGGSKSGDHR